MPAEDLDLCLTLNRFDFVLGAVPDSEGGIRLEKLMLSGRRAAELTVTLPGGG
jgi:hypothetical protein